MSRRFSSVYTNRLYRLQTLQSNNYIQTIKMTKQTNKRIVQNNLKVRRLNGNCKRLQWKVLTMGNRKKKIKRMKEASHIVKTPLRKILFSNVTFLLFKIYWRKTMREVKIEREGEVMIFLTTSTLLWVISTTTYKAT